MSKQSYLERIRSCFAKSATKESPINGLKLHSQKLLWITPFSHYKLSSNIYEPIHSEICALTQAEYTKFIESSSLLSAESDPAIINNDFFKYQGTYVRKKTHFLTDDKFTLNAGWYELEQSESFKQLKQYIYKSVLSYFEDCIQNKQTLDILLNKSLNAYCWISIHQNDSHHPSHTHADSIVSGVYYIRVPSENAHSIVFQDPKGIDLYNPESTFNQRPCPFDNEFAFQPNEGDLILFPSWLPHRVVAPSNDIEQPTNDQKLSRLSLAFNVLGSWKHNAAKHVDLD